MEKIGINVRGHGFEIQVTGSGIKFFEIRQGSHVQLGSAQYKISKDGKILHITSGSFTIDPKRFGLSKSDIGRVERMLVGEAEKAIFKKHPEIKRAYGMVYDTHRKEGIEAEALFNPKRRGREVPERIRFGRGKRKRAPGKQRRRPR